MPRSLAWTHILSATTIGVFSVMLVGTSKPKGTDAGGDAAASAASAAVSTGATPGSASAAPTSAAWRVPDSSTWPEQKLAKAKISVRLPPATKIVLEGNDPSFSGAHFQYLTASGYKVGFAEKSTSEKVDPETERKSYVDEHRGVVVFSDGNAVIATRKEGSRPYCEVTACGGDAKKRLCELSAGLLIDGAKMIQLTNEECLQVVAVARSIRPL
jgi:hypothetical protein